MLLLVLFVITSKAQSIMPINNPVEPYMALRCWYPSADTNVTGYFLYDGTNQIDCGLFTYKWMLTTNCNFAVTAYNSDGLESDKVFSSQDSNIPTIIIKLKSPIQVLNTSADLLNWQPYMLSTVTILCTNQQQFFKQL